MNRWLKLAYCVALFLVVFGGRLWLIDRCASDVPSWDQWDGIGGTLFLPYAGHTLTAADFVKPHNEHRILFTRLLSLGLMLANHQWDNRLETVANSGLFALTAVLLFWMILQWGPRGISVPLGFPLIALAFSLPFSWENTLFGFQSQFYFLILFSIIALALWVMNPPGSRRWLAGWGFALLSIFTTASGVLAACAVLAFSVLEGARPPRRWKAASLSVGAAAVIIVTGWLLNVSLERHEALRAHSILQLIVAFGQNLSWPNMIWPRLDYPWLAFLNWLPALLLAWSYWRAEGPYPKLEKLTLVLGLWVVLQSAVMAYARGGPSWRYMDVMSLGMVVNGISIGLLLVRRPWPRLAGVLAAAFVGWVILGGAGLLTLTRHVIREEIPRKMLLADVQRENLRAFLATGDGRCLTAKSSEEISFPSTGAWALICLLRDPFIRDILPAGIRRPLSIAPQSSYGHAFVRNGVDPSVSVADYETVWGSYSGRGPAAEGAWVSQPLSSRFPFLRFELAGFLGKDYLVMKLTGLSSQRDIGLHPDGAAGSSWTPLLVRAPAGLFAIEAIDDHAQRWFAFKEPTEVGLLSWLAIRLAQRGSGLLAVGLLLFGVMGMGRYFHGLGRGGH
ncbi:MAG: hypothetical protein KKG09_00320 [Verrucomicrobia bacterium]|nr:hypothetical protein [Verrucomicrobiota bacterium]MCG2679637.1 hypothetical protein [Kiritimatiellia bacterium]MBU4247962.1 hypothetical protein [Verrucomicrobiota bacterium]MBU4291459.1 hypothetical protein [Verrucomicrobiota bacterium]MBU4428361.1 hypothetical protein [Verrucomicrobiota bacterium]